MIRTPSGELILDILSQRVAISPECGIIATTDD